LLECIQHKKYEGKEICHILLIRGSFLLDACSCSLMYSTRSFFSN
jgi:hypothetical protein